ncbi:hypothetical protein CH063_06002, partial [Colletotrichum higginsianum]
MLSGDLLRWLAVLILSNRVFSVPHQDKWQDLTIHKRNHLLARQDPPPDTMAPTPYIILADRDATREQIQNLKNILSTEAVPGSLEEVPSKRTGLVVFFKAAITSAQADAIAKVPGFGSATPDSKLEEDQPPSPAAPPSSSTPSQPSATGPPGSPQTTLPNPADIGLQSDAADDLKIISQPRGSSLKDIPAFGYASEAGKGVTIYAIDTGANIQHPEWTGMTGDKSFIYAPGAVQEETDFASHGSCVASKSAGPAYGTAKDANMVMVKLPDDLSLSAVFAALVEVSNDVYEKGIEGKAVIVMALGHTIPDLQMSTETAYRLLIIAIMAEDIVIVTASGNEATDEFDDLSDYPALFGDTTDIIVVGGVTNDGSRAFFSQGTGDQLTTSAPAFISCASGGSSGSKRAYGTSFGEPLSLSLPFHHSPFPLSVETHTQEEASLADCNAPAAPTVAGVVAVWLSQAEHHARLQVPGEVAAKAKAMTAPGRRRDGLRRRDHPDLGAAAAAPTGSSSTTSRPPPPPPPFRPSWSENPQGFRRVFERDGVASDNYDATSNSASERVTGNIEQWCLAKCT